MESENQRFPKCVPVVYVAVIKKHDSSEILSKVFSNVHITLECLFQLLLNKLTQLIYLFFIITV